MVSGICYSDLHLTPANLTKIGIANPPPRDWLFFVKGNRRRDLRYTRDLKFQNFYFFGVGFSRPTRISLADLN